MKIIAFAGSNSSQSINHALLDYVGTMSDEVELIRLSEYDAPMYSMDIEQADGIPQTTQALNEKLQTADKLIISVAEHNGNLSAFFKNQLDWLSRHNREFLKDKKVLLLSTSPGGGGGTSALNVAKNTLPFFGAEVVDSYSVSTFYDVFKDGKIVDNDINQQLKQLVQQFIFLPIKSV